VRYAIIVSVLLLTSCANPEKDWKLASRDDSTETYLEFLAKHPDSPQATLARERIQELKVIRAWERAEFKDTEETYGAFIEKYPGSEFAPESEARMVAIQRDAQWELVSETESPAALEGFIKTYPDAPQRPDAETRLAEIKLTELATIEAAKPKERPGAFRLQLAAFRTPAAADTELRRLIELFPTELLGPVRIETPADRNNGGSMFLLKTVPMNGPEAREICELLQNRGQNCLIINR
jgi:hypothetical protein